MSLEFWKMKVGGSYVLHNSKFRYVESCDYDREVYDKLKSTRYPEDILPAVKFKLKGLRAAVKYNDFEIVHPDDGMFVIDDTLALVNRSMERNYKLAPSSRSYNCHTTSKYDTHKWLNITLGYHHDTWESILDLEKNAYTFNRYVGATKGRFGYEFMFGDTNVATLLFKEGYVTLEIVKGMTPPKSLLDNLGHLVGAKHYNKKSKEPKKVKSNNVLKGLNYTWTRYKTINGFISSNRRYRYLLVGRAIHFKIRGNSYSTRVIRDKAQMLKPLLAMDTGSFSDVSKIIDSLMKEVENEDL